MIHICMLSPGYQMVLILLLFLVLFCEVILLVYKGSHLLPVKKLVPDGVLVFVLLVLLYLLVQGSQTSEWMFHIPAGVLAVVLISLSFYLVAGFIRERKRIKRELSPLAVQQAIDDLPLGICFADPSGTLILCNRVMSGLGTVLLGSHPQTREELEHALKHLPRQSSVTNARETKNGFCFPDGKIWIFKTSGLTMKGLEGYSQMTAHDMTDLCHENMALEEANRHLGEVMEKLQRMYERMADTVREKESLELKVYIHDILGRGLLTIRDIMDSSSGSVEKKMDLLKEALSYLTSTSPAASGSLEEVQQEAEKLGVRVKLEGYVPPDTEPEHLTAAAIRECVTNCVRHAHGNEVSVSIHETSGILKVTITNNGELPKGKIVEGSGLSALHHSVEAYGGEMYLSHVPAFALTLYLPRKEMNEL